MIRKIDKYKQAIILRQAGESIKAIAKKLMISSSTSSLWCRNIILTPEQLSKLRTKSGNIELLKKLSQKKHLDKIQRHNLIFNQAAYEIALLNENEFFIAGVALYWAEGFKNPSEGRIGFCNSDPRMVKFMLKWFKQFFSLRNEDFILRAEFNIDHLDRKKEIEEYWSKLTNIPQNQFNNPFLQKTKWQKTYLNRNTYFGTLRIRLKKSSALLPKMRGWIEGLSHAA